MGLDKQLNFSFEGYVYTAIDSKVIKNIFTTSFVLLGFAIHVVGTVYLKRRNVAKLNRLRESERVVPLTWLTSWLPLSAVIKYYWKTRRLPGGIFSFAMIITGIFNVAHPYFVNNLFTLESVPVPQICSFQSGIITLLGNGGVPISTLACASTVNNAQLNVYMNGGDQGVWRLINNISDQFYPFQDQDFLGKWSCNAHPSTPIDVTQLSNYDNFTDTVETLLDSQEFLFSEARVPVSLSYSFGASTGFMAWSANETNDSNNTWAVRASIANNIQAVQAVNQKYANMTNLECTLQNFGNWTPPIMPSNDTLTEWAPSTYGFLMNDVPEFFGFDIEWKLNAMTMISGTGNNDMQTLDKLEEIGEPAFYGCLINDTQLNPAIWGVLGAVLLILAAVSIGAVTMFIPQMESRKSESGALIENTPADIDDWQIAALKQYISEDITLKQAKDYSFGWDSNRGAFVYARNDSFQTGIFPPHTDAHEPKQGVTYSIAPIESKNV